MFSRMRPLLKVRVVQNVLRGCKTEKSFEQFMSDITEKPVKNGYSLLFFDDEIQKLLKQVSNIKLEKVFALKPRHAELEPAVYKLLTTEEVEAERKKIEKKADYFLQIPPLVNVEEDKTDILSSDLSLDGFDEHHSKHVFIDISYNKSHGTRAVVVREPNGILRTGNNYEAHRVNQIFFPIEGREIETPEMFQPEHLMEVIKRKDYEFILDRACAQFEPDAESYHKVITLTYEAINFHSDFEMLHSTRHFGSLVFYLVTHKKIDNILSDNILKNRLDDAFSLVKIYHIVHPDCESSKLSAGKTEMEKLKDFINLDSVDKNKLKASLNQYMRKKEEEKELESGIKEAHGL